MDDDDSLEAFAAGLTFTTPAPPAAITARPFLKWVGGKGKLITALLDIFPRKIRRYYEPFLGGGAVFWALAEAQAFEAALLNDWNDELVTTYRVVRDFPEDLVQRLQLLALAYIDSPEATFKAWRDPGPLNPVDRAARFIFLNKTGFNGLYRLNGDGKYNVPWGRYTNPAICNAPLLRGCSLALNKLVTLRQGDFAEACQDAGPGDLVYLDPPYAPVSDTANFTGYTEQGFTLDDQYRVAALFRQLQAQGAAVVLSNSDTPEIRALFAGYEMHTVPMRRNVSSKGDGRGPVPELIVVSRRAPPRLDVPLLEIVKPGKIPVLGPEQCLANVELAQLARLVQHLIPDPFQAVLEVDASFLHPHLLAELLDHRSTGVGADEGRPEPRHGRVVPDWLLSGGRLRGPQGLLVDPPDHGTPSVTVDLLQGFDVVVDGQGGVLGQPGQHALAALKLDTLRDNACPGDAPRVFVAEKLKSLHSPSR